MDQWIIEISSGLVSRVCRLESEDWKLVDRGQKLMSCQLNLDAKLKVGSWQSAVGKNQNSSHKEIKTI